MPSEYVCPKCGGEYYTEAFGWKICSACGASMQLRDELNLDKT